MTPKVSVVIPTYNRAKWVGGAIRSILAQDVDLELVVLDNGSSDGTWALLQEFQAQDPRIQIVRWDYNNGTEAYPFLLSEATGEYLTFFADDDEMLPGGLARKAAVLDARPEIGLVFSTVRTMDETGADQGEASWSVMAGQDLLGGSHFFDALILSNLVPMPAALYRRSLNPVGEILRDPGFGHAKDWQFWLDLARRTEVAYLREPTVRLRLHNTQSTVVDGVRAGGFIESSLHIWRHWMLEADPPYIPSSGEWDKMQRHLAGLLQASHGKDGAACMAGLHRLQELRTLQDARLASLQDSLPEAFLHEPAWDTSAWVEVLLSYLEAFEPGEPVALAFLTDPARAGALAPDPAREAVLRIIAQTGRERFPDVLLIDEPSEALAALRAFPYLQWIPSDPGAKEGLEGPLGQRFAAARRRMAHLEPA